MKKKIRQGVTHLTEKEDCLLQQVEATSICLRQSLVIKKRKGAWIINQLVLLF